MQKLTIKAHSMGGSVPMGELFTPEFMKANSDCEGIDELFTAGGFNVQSWADLEAITDEQMDPVVRQHKKFISWQEFTQAVRGKALELNVAQDNYEHPLVRVARDVAEKAVCLPSVVVHFSVIESGDLPPVAIVLNRESLLLCRQLQCQSTMPPETSIL